MKRLALAALMASLASSVALGDTVVLDTGAVLEGEVEQTPAGIKIAFPTGWTAEIPQASIRSVHVEQGDQSAAAEPATCRVVQAPKPRPRVTRAQGRRFRAQAQSTTLARSIRASFQRGWRGQAERLIEEHPNAYRWDQLGDAATLSCAYDGRRMTVSVARQDTAREDMVVAFSPGTYGQERDGQRYQDLVFLRAPVVVIPAGQTTAQVQVPVACARYGWSTPRTHQPYTLDRFEADSDMDRLLVQLCAGAKTPAEEASQLAVWAVRNRLTQGQFEERYTTFDNSRLIKRSASGHAAELIERSGVDPAAYPFFRAEGQEAPNEAAPEEPTPPQPEARRPRRLTVSS
jgi:hypothetical protein